MTMRAVDCPCGITLTAADDQGLVGVGLKHRDEHHQNDNISDEFVREHVSKNAHDVAQDARTSTARQ